MRLHADSIATASRRRAVSDPPALPGPLRSWPLL